ncbi:glycoside hydrolase family 128 protein, partial [Aureobasidium sp. EXF-3399]
MSSINTKLAILALAGSAVAVPSFGHGKHHGKHHHHNKHFFGSSGVATGTGAPYGMANATGIWGTGTAASAGLPSGHSFVHPSAIGPHTGSSEAAPKGTSTSTCTSSVVSITHTNRVTITVHATSAEAAPVQTTFSTKAYTSSADVNSTAVAFSSAVALSSSVLVESSASFSSSSVIPAESSAPALDLDLQNKGHRKWTRSSTAAASTSTAAAQSTSATSVAPVSTSTSSSISSTFAVAPTSAVIVSSSTKASSTSSSAVPTSSSTGSGKRGLAYNTASLLTCFEDSTQVSWGYNWDSDSAGLSSSFNYVPLLWGLSHTDVWNSRATSAIANGATHLMSFNEPDMTSQANMSPEDAASAYKTYMMPFAGKAKLGAPAVTNGGGSMGLNWLAAFLEACDGCQVDFVTIHWYDSASNTAYFKEHVQNATDVAGGKPVWVTEFAPTGNPSNADISTFLEDVMPWMDSQSFVERYSYFMASDGALISGTEPSTFGQTYATYSS